MNWQFANGVWSKIENDSVRRKLTKLSYDIFIEEVSRNIFPDIEITYDPDIIQQCFENYISYFKKRTNQFDFSEFPFDARTILLFALEYIQIFLNWNDDLMNKIIPPFIDATPDFNKIESIAITLPFDKKQEKKIITPEKRTLKLSLITGYNASILVEKFIKKLEKSSIKKSIIKSYNNACRDKVILSRTLAPITQRGAPAQRIQYEILCYGVFCLTIYSQNNLPDQMVEYNEKEIPIYQWVNQIFLGRLINHISATGSTEIKKFAESVADPYTRISEYHAQFIQDPFSEINIFAKNIAKAINFESWPFLDVMFLHYPNRIWWIVKEEMAYYWNQLISYLKIDLASS